MNRAKEGPVYDGSKKLLDRVFGLLPGQRGHRGDDLDSLNGHKAMAFHHLVDHGDDVLDLLLEVHRHDQDRQMPRKV